MSGGFEHCPVTLAFAIFTTFSSLFKKKSFQNGIDTLALTRGEFSRLITGHVCFSSMPQVFIGVMLMYTMRQFERQLGTRKFGSFVAVSYAIATLSQLAVVTTASSMGISISMAPGPYFFIYSLLALYHRHVPKLHPSRHSLLGGFRFSEKTWTYLFALQLLLGDGIGSVCAGGSGLAAGYLYLSNILCLQSFRMPRFIERLCSPVSYLLGNNYRPNTAVPNPLGGTGVGRAPRVPAVPEFQRQQQDDGYSHMLPPQVTAPPSEEDIQSIVNLGFERQQAINALRLTGNNVEAAANNLFSGTD